MGVIDMTDTKHYLFTVAMTVAGLWLSHIDPALRDPVLSIVGTVIGHWFGYSHGLIAGKGQAPSAVS